MELLGPHQNFCRSQNRGTKAWQLAHASGPAVVRLQYNCIFSSSHTLCPPRAHWWSAYSCLISHASNAGERHRKDTMRACKLHSCWELVDAADLIGWNFRGHFLPPPGVLRRNARVALNALRQPKDCYASWNNRRIGGALNCARPGVRIPHTVPITCGRWHESHRPGRRWRGLCRQPCLQGAGPVRR